jgi:histidinol-phosphate phosphatase family protein
VTARRAAVFLDRDGNISRPEDVDLLPDAAHAIRRLNDAGVAAIVISNQSGIGRGYFARADYERAEARVEQLLAEAAGARLDAVYICPHAPDDAGRDACACRKPGTLLFRRAADELGLDPERSWCVGDRWRDVQPAAALGARALLVPSSATPSDELARARAAGVPIAPSLAAAVDRILAVGEAGMEAGMTD